MAWSKIGRRRVDERETRRKNDANSARSLLAGRLWKERRDLHRYIGGEGGERPGFGVSAGRRFMCLLIESFSLDRAACFLPSREIASSVLLFCSFSLSFSLSCAPIRAPFFSPASRRYVRIARGISVARVSQNTGEVALNRRGDWESVFVFRKRFSQDTVTDCSCCGNYTCSWQIL